MRNRPVCVALATLLVVYACAIISAPSDVEDHEPEYQTAPVEIEVIEVDEPKVEEPEVEVLKMEVELPKVEEPKVEPLKVEEPRVEELVEEEPDVWGMTEYELDIVRRVVTAEAGGESYEGQMAVAQCIRETAKATGMTPYEVVTQRGQYTTPSSFVTDSVLDAVQAVLFEGESVTDEPIRYFYAPAMVYSEWHETALEFVCEIGGHRFFMDKG